MAGRVDLVPAGRVPWCGGRGAGALPSGVDGLLPVSSHGPPRVLTSSCIRHAEPGQLEDLILTRSPLERPHLQTIPSEVLAGLHHELGGEHSSAHDTYQVNKSSSGSRTGG